MAFVFLVLPAIMLLAALFALICTTLVFITAWFILDIINENSPYHHVDKSLANKYPTNKPLSIEDTPAIHSLNDDVVYYIACTLPPVDAASFVLSCRAIWQATTGQNFLNKLYKLPKGRLRLLERLEEDFPLHVLCYRCEKFHCRCSQLPPLLKSAECDLDSGVFFLGSPCEDLATTYFTYRQAKEIMNHYRFGPANGRGATDVINHHTFTQLDETFQTRTAWSFDVKLINNMLVLKQDTWVVYLYNCDKSMDHAVQICGHWGEHLLYGIEDISRESHQCYRCPYSLSERELRIYHLKQLPGHALLHSTLWENLGSCRNTGSNLWNHASWGMPCTSHPLKITPEETKYRQYFDNELPRRDCWGRRITILDVNCSFKLKPMLDVVETHPGNKWSWISRFFRCSE
ncbi:uncharacterized protein MCYG_01079 [Microsporum canis CBS 113480]|uniref:F-box domain-containing protein n=1 Tax=Arthroderma otae (strain ATCC MYA-4605 / CBS 113480) TaxID=554155 RepID=C5FEF7_ARTOC|nr:uncharacterized protein MCYG_01079 [Microsporum canis CBS 113480]EEQ28191.1 predicted protein [Microsporum canis CBS 113480]